MKRNRWTIVVSVAVLVFLFALTGQAIAEQSAPSLVVSPISGKALIKLTFYGSGFEPGEKVRVIMEFNDVPYAFGTVGTGGVLEVNENGAFKLEPRGGIPKQYVEPGVYTIQAIGDKGSYATHPLEILGE
jgi:hypothetical protein